jgi:hypothetical protein
MVQDALRDDSAIGGPTGVDSQERLSFTNGTIERRRRVPIDAERLGDRIGRLPLAARWAIFWRSSLPRRGLPILLPFAFAQGMRLVTVVSG